MAFPVRIAVKTATVPHKQIKTIIAIPFDLQIRQIIHGGLTRFQKAPNQKPPRKRPFSERIRFPEIGKGREAPCSGNAEPRPAATDIAPGQDIRPVFPKGQRSRGAMVEFIPVGGQDEAIPGMGVAGKEYQTHLIDNAKGVVDFAGGSSIRSGFAPDRIDGF